VGLDSPPLAHHLNHRRPTRAIIIDILVDSSSEDELTTFPGTLTTHLCELRHVANVGNFEVGLHFELGRAAASAANIE
jgi:hypothetical protein